tara:strand:- start:185 stop:1192 length:1008 start_codon:yes stop_codon:yes gene_type:complete
MDGINLNSVTEWLAEYIEDLSPPLEFSLIAGGHSNLTYKFSDSTGFNYVLRRPPLGHVLESAHDMVREHRIISALGGSSVPVPETVVVCEDKAINDAPFYVMKFVSGDVLHDKDGAKSTNLEDRFKIGRDVVSVLARLHSINPDDVGLGDLGRRSGYIERQLKRWTAQWDASKTEEVPAMEEVSILLHEKMPEQIGATIVHGDYRLGNMIVEDGSIRAVLDWELCTLGDPLADLGYLLNNWVLPGEDELANVPTAVGGFPDRDALCLEYERATGRDLSRINYYRAFSHWRLAAINQGVYKRYLVGAMGDRDDGIDLEAQLAGVKQKAITALDLMG